MHASLRIASTAVRALLAAACLPAIAQDQPAGADQRVIVTGSQIPRIDGETALPVQIITHEDIERSGVQDIEQLMSLISANFGGQNIAEGVGDSIRPGFSGASLRGLGDRYTLVLLDGRRVANHAFSDEVGIGVDLATIPLAAIERVEVLRDGASAIYGSDAIAGVVNFILKSDFSGAEASVSREWAGAGGGGASQTSTFGAGRGALATDGYNLLAVVSRHQEQAMSTQSRWFSDTDFLPAIGLFGVSRSAFPANLLLPDGSTVSPAAPACSPTTIALGSGCWYDPARLSNMIPKQDNLGFLGRATLALPHGDSIRAELLWSRAKERFQAAPSPINFGGLAGEPAITIPVDSPYYPAGLGLTPDNIPLFYRTTTLGPRITDSTTTQQRLLLAWRGEVASWSLDAALLQSTSRSTLDFVSGYVDSDAIVAALATGSLNPFGDSGPVGDALLASTRATGRAHDAVGQMRSVDLHATRDLMRLNDAPLTLGVGAELRHEMLDDRTTPLGDRAAGVGERPNPKAGLRDMQAAYAELELPLAHRLDAQLALRVEHYSDFGTGYNPKVSLRWRQASSLLLRASAGTGMRVPTLPELYSPVSDFTYPQGLPDPIRCPVTHADSDCSLEVPVTTGGNRALQPERSRQASIGIVLAPSKDSTLTVDWWQLRLRHEITEPGDALVLDGNPRFEVINIQRGPVDPAYPTLPGPITGLNEINQNLFSQALSGVDVDLNLRSSATRFGRFSVGLDGSWLADFSTLVPDQPRARAAGQFGLPRWCHTLTLGWDREAWKFTLSQQFIGSTLDFHPMPDMSLRRVAPYDIWDTQLAWDPSKAWTIALGVRNLADKVPPASNVGSYGFDNGNADPRGRLVYARLDARWH
jgi:iron complex outermembrane receptor protein